MVRAYHVSVGGVAPVANLKSVRLRFPSARMWHPGVAERVRRTTPRCLVGHPHLTLYPASTSSPSLR
jgi:hypothetical protein